MTDKQQSSKSGRQSARPAQRTRSPEPESPAFDKKLDGPNRPST